MAEADGTFAKPSCSAFVDASWTFLGEVVVSALVIIPKECLVGCDWACFSLRISNEDARGSVFELD